MIVSYLLNFAGDAEGIFTPACRALDNKIAFRCDSARAAPNFRRVAFTIAGGFVLSS
jgi:hypothetical protein